ncbi:MAG TPA: phosphonate ABC transporter, permease protein PhnE [Anaerolineaceae bacterium]
MTATPHSKTFADKTSTATVISLVFPGTGQFVLHKRWRGLLIFLCTLLLGGLVYWAQTDLDFGLVTMGSAAITWLWFPFLLFWAWNVVDAYRLSKGHPFNGLLGLFLATLVLFVIAWNVTDVKLDRLITRFDDARIVMSALVNPDLITTNLNGNDQICDWGCMAGYLRARVTGQATQGPIRISDNLMDIIGNVGTVTIPRWLIKAGMVAEGTQITGFNAGKLFETIAIGLMATLFSTVLAIPVSFLAAHNIMSRVRGGSVIYYVSRTLLNIVRAVDPFVWGLIVIIWVGLGSFAGVIALTIHSIAALGKLLSEEVEHIDPGPVEALTATGANLFQVIRYGVIPQIIPPFLAYTLLRWDINMRAATIVGFVAGGGMGFLMVETIRKHAYQQYAAALWVVAIVIILVDMVSAKWREAILKDQPAKVEGQTRSLSTTLKRSAYIIIGLALFVYCWGITGISPADLFQPGSNFTQLISDFIHIDLSPDVLSVVVTKMVVTIFQAMLATTFGAILAIPFSFLAANNLTGRSRLSRWLYYLTRSLFNILRSIEALLYAAIFVFWVGIGPFAGTLALAVTTFALIGKLFSEAIENIEPGSIEATTATGANLLQVINYAILPQIIPPFVSYLIYQWDINIRMATIIGFAGGGGIGLTLSTYFGMLQYHKAGTVILLIVIVVALMDLSSAKLREKLI